MIQLKCFIDNHSEDINKGHYILQCDDLIIIPTISQRTIVK